VPFTSRTRGGRVELDAAARALGVIGGEDREERFCPKRESVVAFVSSILRDKASSR